MVSVICGGEPTPAGGKRQAVGMIDARVFELEFGHAREGGRPARPRREKRDRSELEIAGGEIAVIRRQEGHTVREGQFRARAADLERRRGIIIARSVAGVDGDGAVPLRDREQFAAVAVREGDVVRILERRLADYLKRRLVEPAVSSAAKQQNGIAFRGRDRERVTGRGKGDAFEPLALPGRGGAWNGGGLGV